MVIDRFLKALAIVGAVGLVALAIWAYLDYRHREPAMVDFEGTLEEFGSVHWSLARDVVWGEQLSPSVELMGKTIVFDVDEGGILRVNIVASSHNLLQWLEEEGIQIPPGSILLPLLNAPSLTLTADQAVVRIGMLGFDAIGLTYHKETGAVGSILQFQDTNQSGIGDWTGLASEAEALVFGEVASRFCLQLEDGYSISQYCVKESRTGPSGDLVVIPSSPDRAVLLLPNLVVAMPSIQPAVQTYERWGFIVRIVKGQARIHTKVRWLTSKDNLGSIQIGDRQHQPVEREVLTLVQFGGTRGGELEIDTGARRLHFFGKAVTVNIDGDEQLTRRLNEWPWYRRWVLTTVFSVLILQGVLFRLFRRYRKVTHKASD